MIEEFIKQNKKYCKQETIGLSENKQPIYALDLKKGRGQRKKVLLISYLHGNEIDTIITNKKILQTILHEDLLNFWEIKSIPIANPDGKKLQKRCNSKGVDINRDFIKKRAKETKAIIDLCTRFKPELVLDYHQNLSNKYSGIILPSSMRDDNLIKNIISSYRQIVEEPHLFQVPYLYSKNKLIASFLTEGVYRMLKEVGLLIDYAAKKSNLAVLIEDYSRGLSIEFSTELLKTYSKR